jgi:hypothetical protein
MAVLALASNQEMVVVEQPLQSGLLVVMPPLLQVLQMVALVQLVELWPVAA